MPIDYSGLDQILKKNETTLSKLHLFYVIPVGGAPRCLRLLSSKPLCFLILHAMVKILPNDLEFILDEDGKLETCSYQSSSPEPGAWDSVILYTTAEIQKMVDKYIKEEYDEDNPLRLIGAPHYNDYTERWEPRTHARIGPESFPMPLTPRIIAHKASQAPKRVRVKA